MWDLHHISRHVASICLPFPPGLICSYKGCLEVIVEQRHAVSLSDEITSLRGLLSCGPQSNLQPLHELNQRGSHTHTGTHLLADACRLSNSSLPPNNQTILQSNAPQGLLWQSRNTQKWPVCVQNLQSSLRGWLPPPGPQSPQTTQFSATVGEVSISGLFTRQALYCTCSYTNQFIKMYQIHKQVLESFQIDCEC